MRTAPILAAMLALSVVFAGCTSKNQDEPDDAIQTPNPPPITTTRAPAPTTSAAPPPIPDPVQVYTGNLEYKTTENTADQAFNVPANAKRVEATFHVKATNSGAYSVQGENNQGKPKVMLIAPDGTETPIEFDPSSAGVSSTAGQSLEGPFTHTVSTPAAGSWQVGIRGTGYNVHVESSLTAYFE